MSKDARVVFLRVVAEEELASVLEVYRQSEDFLALGPSPYASVEMVREDLLLSKEYGGKFSGIYVDEHMVGVVDYVFSGFEGIPEHAYITLILIARPWRSSGLGHAVLEMVEQEIYSNPEVTRILTNVQVDNPRAVEFWARRGYGIVAGPELMPDGTTVYSLIKELKAQMEN